jgi:hypothetical protein
MGVARSQRQKLSRAAGGVNRECGTESTIGGGSGELLGGVMNISKTLVLWRRVQAVEELKVNIIC